MMLLTIMLYSKKEILITFIFHMLDQHSNKYLITIVNNIQKTNFINSISIIY